MGTAFDAYVNETQIAWRERRVETREQGRQNGRSAGWSRPKWDSGGNNEGREQI